MKIAPATPEDALAIATVHIRSWQVAYAHILAAEYLSSLSVEGRAERWQGILATKPPRSDTLVARHEDEIAGFVSYGKCRDDTATANQGEIRALYVSPAVWGQGFGRALLDEAVRRLGLLGLSRASLWVLARNRRGAQFYESCGFQKVVGSERFFELGGREVEEVAYLLPP